MDRKTGFRLWTCLAACSLLLLLTCGGVIYLVGSAIGRFGQSLETDTKVAVRPETPNGQLELALTYGGEATGITTVRVADEAGNTLWEVTGGGTDRPARIVYGQLPPAGVTPWRQVFPADGTPPADIRGRRVRVWVTNRYQVAFGPGQEITEVTADVPE